MTSQEMKTDQENTGTLNSSFYLEIACFDAKSLLLADSAGADRTEFCADRALGGVTPPLQEVLDILPLLQKPVHIMIRPRGGNFVYSDAEFKQMKYDVHIIKAAPVPGKLGGFVFGILDATGQVDMSRNCALVELARPLSCTFHRAFDEMKDLEKALENVIACGFQIILTSGGAADSASGAGVLGGLVAKADGRITVMPGGGVRSSNIELLREKTKAKWYHSSAVVRDEISVKEVEVLNRVLKAEQ